MRIEAFNVGEVVKDFIIGLAVVPDLLVAQIQIAALAAAIQVAGHLDEYDIGIVCFQCIHQVKVGIDISLSPVRSLQKANRFWIGDWLYRDYLCKFLPIE